METHVSERERFSSRNEIEHEIERLLLILDIFDPDPDLEPQGDEEPDNDDEAELGWSEPWMPTPEHTGYGTSIAMVRLLNAKPIWPREFSTVTPDKRDCACLWASAKTSRSQCEDEGSEHDGREPCEEGEPSLGWTFHETVTGRYAREWSSLSDTEADLGSLDGQIHQGNWWRGRNDDAELQCEDEGYQCDDEGHDSDDDDDREGDGPVDRGYPGPVADAEDGGIDILTGEAVNREFEICFGGMS